MSIDNKKKLKKKSINNIFNNLRNRIMEIKSDQRRYEIHLNDKLVNIIDNIHNNNINNNKIINEINSLKENTSAIIGFITMCVFVGGIYIILKKEKKE